MGQIKLSNGIFETEGLRGVSVTAHPAAWLARLMGAFLLLFAALGVFSIGTLMFSLAPDAWKNAAGLLSGVGAVVGTGIGVALVIGLFSLFAVGGFYLLRGKREDRLYVYLSAGFVFLSGIVNAQQAHSSDTSVVVCAVIALLLVVAAEAQGRKSVHFHYGSNTMTASFVSAVDAERALQEYEVLKAAQPAPAALSSVA